MINSREKKRELGSVKTPIYTSCFRKMDCVILPQLFIEVINVLLCYTVCFAPSNLKNLYLTLSASEITTTFGLILDDVFMKNRITYANPYILSPT